jgi:hypothetical protein
MARSGAWTNKDGIVVGFGARTVQKNEPTQVKTFGNIQELVLKLSDLTLLSTVATGGAGIYAPQYIAQAPRIPANSTVQEVRITTDVAATSGGAADLLLGVYTVTASTKAVAAVDDDGLLAAGDSALADYSVAGETMVLGKAAGAALLGKTTVGASPVIVLPIYVTAAYTAGALSVHITYSTPVN